MNNDMTYQPLSLALCPTLSVSQCSLLFNAIPIQFLFTGGFYFVSISTFCTSLITSLNEHDIPTSLFGTLSHSFSVSMSTFVQILICLKFITSLNEQWHTNPSLSLAFYLTLSPSPLLLNPNPNKFLFMGGIILPHLQLHFLFKSPYQPEWTMTSLSLCPHPNCKNQLNSYYVGGPKVETNNVFPLSVHRKFTMLPTAEVQLH